MSNDDEYYLQTAYALAGCQMLEQELKLYISDALALVHRCVADKVPFKFSGDDYLDASLERLIDVFRKLSENPNLVARLRKFKDTRNHLAHRSITECLDYDGDLFLPKSEETLALLNTIQEEANMLRHAVRYEAQKFTPELDYGNLSSDV
jgi:hypothetical protein